MSIITAADLAAHLGIPDSQDDTWIENAASAANRAVQRYCGRTFTATSTASASAKAFKPKTPTLCITDDFWSTTNLVVKTDEGDDGTYESTLTLNTDFVLEPTNGMEDGLTVPYYRLVGTSWVFPTLNVIPSVQVTAAWGWESVPGDVKLATLIKGAKLFKRKDSIEGVLGGFQEFGLVRVSPREDPDVASLLRDYRTARAALLVT